MVQEKFLQKRERRCWKPPKHNTEAIRTPPKICLAKEKGFTKTQRRGGQFWMETLKTKARREKKEKGNMRNASKYNRKLNPRSQLQTDSRG